MLCRSLSVTVLGRVCGRRRRRPRRGSLEVACVRVAVTAYSRVDGVWCHTYAIAATRHTLSSRRGGRHRREIRRDNGIHGTPGRHRAAHRRPGVVERRRRRDLSGPVATRPGRPPRASKVPSRRHSRMASICSAAACCALAPPWDPRGAHAWRRRTRSIASSSQARAGQPPVRGAPLAALTSPWQQQPLKTADATGRRAAQNRRWPSCLQVWSAPI